MKTIEEINNLNVKKIQAEKKFLNFLRVTQLKLELELPKQKEKEFNILKVFV